MEPMRPYILDDAATLEYQRLDLMSRILDPWTRGYLAGLGVGQGWDCLELGSGNGSIVEWLCDAVGPSGSVTAADINTVLLELIPAQNLTVQQLDVRTRELPEDAYDLVTCRALLHQIAEYAPAVLARMAAAVKPGGWLLVQEPDFHLAPTTEPAAWATTWKASGDPGRRPTCRISVAGTAERCSSGCSSPRYAIVWPTVVGSTRPRSTPPQVCWTIRTTGRSAG
jgi:2-polyprenyl-3-methyl-5-hydroxy-6-metoxy-1,4-benzoquinol methylase